MNILVTTLGLLLFLSSCLAAAQTETENLTKVSKELSTSRRYRQENVEDDSMMMMTDPMDDGDDGMPKTNQIEPRKKKGGMEQMYMMFMMCKSLISTLMMFVGPIIQVKSFGLSVIGTLLNIARFIMQLKESKSQMSSGYGANASPWREEDRIGLVNHFPVYNSQPNYIHRYTVSS